MISDDDPADVGVSSGADLRRFARAVLARDRESTDDSAEAVQAQLGPLALSRAAGVVAFFDAINRVADATGVELDEYVNLPVELDLSWIERKRAAV